MMMHVCNPSIQGAEAGESGIHGKPELHRKTLSQEKKEGRKVGREGENGREKKRERKKV
jgi:hypothetical protein